MTTTPEHESEALSREWSTERRWKGVSRDYGPDEVVNLRGSMRIEYSLARHGAEVLHRRDYYHPGFPGAGPGGLVSGLTRDPPPGSGRAIRCRARPTPRGIRSESNAA